MTERATIPVQSSVGNGKLNNLIPNPLRDFNTYNYIITLGQLSRRYYNDPVGYLKDNSNIFEKVILRSGGGNLENRVTTHAEAVVTNTRRDGMGADIITGVTHAEYYIEDLEISALVDPNPRTGSTLATEVSFSVVEPYSIGLFLQALKIGAIELGYQNHLDCPVAIRVEFVGWGDDGEELNPKIPPILVSLKMTNVELSVSEQGSKYNVTAIYYSEVPLSDRISKIPVSINASGKTVHEILQGETSSAAISVADVINDFYKETEEEKLTYGGDRRIIVFPKVGQIDPRLVGDSSRGTSQVDRELAIGAKLISRTSAPKIFDPKTVVLEEIRRGLGSPGVLDSAIVNIGAPNSLRSNRVSAKEIGELFNALLKWSKNPENVNEIGLSKFIEPKEQSSTPMSDAEIQDGVIIRNNRRDGSGTNTAISHFKEGTKIEKIIEEIIKSSNYYQEQAKEKNKDEVTAHRIETLVFIEDDPDFEQNNGRPRYLFVYMVYPMQLGGGLNTIPNSENPITERELALTKKQYNYFYSGKNEDIISFEVEFKNAFYTMLQSGGYSGSANGNTAGSDQSLQQTTITETGESQDSPATRDAISRGRLTLDGTTNMRGYQTSGGLLDFGSLDLKKNISNTIFDNVLNSSIDMVSFDIEIWGDPYFMPLEHGDYAFYLDRGKRESFMTYMSSFVYVDINFYSPFDYNDRTGLMDMQYEKSPLSGLCMVHSVTNKFSGGQFKQTLNILRFPYQLSSDRQSGPGKPGIGFNVN
jgi:hypothetical protein